MVSSTIDSKTSLIQSLLLSLINKLWSYLVSRAFRLERTEMGIFKDFELVTWDSKTFNIKLYVTYP